MSTLADRDNFLAKMVQPFGREKAPNSAWHWRCKEIAKLKHASINDPNYVSVHHPSIGRAQGNVQAAPMGATISLGMPKLNSPRRINHLIVTN